MKQNKQTKKKKRKRTLDSEQYELEIIFNYEWEKTIFENEDPNLIIKVLTTLNAW